LIVLCSAKNTSEGKQSEEAKLTNETEHFNLHAVEPWRENQCCYTGSRYSPLRRSNFICSWWTGALKDGCGRPNCAGSRVRKIFCSTGRSNAPCRSEGNNTEGGISGLQGRPTQQLGAFIFRQLGGEGSDFPGQGGQNASSRSVHKSRIETTMREGGRHEWMDFR